MKANKFEDILRLYLIENDLGLSNINDKCGDYYEVEITYTEMSIKNGKAYFYVVQRDNLETVKSSNIYLTDILLFIAAY